MDDYIKREDAVRRIAVLMASEAESDGCEDQPMDNYIEYASEDLADIPSADVAPVRHGKWVFVGDNMFECLRCGVVYTLQQLDGLRNYDTDHCMPNYCPNCGAKMDEGGSNGTDNK